MPCSAVPAADTAVEKAPKWDKGLTTRGSHLHVKGTFHLLFLIRKPGTDTVGLLCLPLPLPFTLTWLLCLPQDELSALSERAVALPCLFWKPFHHIPEIQTRPQVCNSSKLSSPACAGVLISEKAQKKTTYSGWVIGFSASMVFMKMAQRHWIHCGASS